MPDPKPYHAERIDRLYAWIASAEEDGKNAEGLAGAILPFPGAPGGVMWSGLIGADRDRMGSLRPVAQRIANESGKALKLVCFEARRELDTRQPAMKGS